MDHPDSSFMENPIVLTRVNRINFQGRQAVAKIKFLSVLCSYKRCIHRELLNLFNKLRKRDKMRGLPSILSLFHNLFNTFNNTRARMLNSI